MIMTAVQDTAMVYQNMLMMLPGNYSPWSTAFGFVTSYVNVFWFGSLATSVGVVECYSCVAMVREEVHYMGIGRGVNEFTL